MIAARHFVLLLSLGLSPSLAEEPELVDRIVAVVDGDALFLSDLARARTLGREAAQLSDRELLDRLIDERLRLHEMERFDVLSVPLEEVERQVEALRERVGGEKALLEVLADASMTLDDLRETFARQLLLLDYVEERLGARVFVDLDDIRAYFDTELAPRLRSEGREVPPLEEVQEQIRTLLRERRLDEEIVLWTAELRARADIRDELDQPAPAPR